MPGTPRQCLSLLGESQLRDLSHTRSHAQLPVPALDVGPRAACNRQFHPAIHRTAERDVAHGEGIARHAGVRGKVRIEQRELVKPVIRISQGEDLTLNIKGVFDRLSAQVAGGTLVNPALANGKLYVRDDRGLICLQLGE